MKKKKNRTEPLERAIFKDYVKEEKPAEDIK